MDLRAYYKSIRETEAAMPAPQVVIVSLATPDGGKAGITTEVPTPIAARMVVEGRARRATDAEAADFHHQQSAARQAAEEAAQAAKVQIVVVPANSTNPKFPGRAGKEL